MLDLVIEGYPPFPVGDMSTNENHTLIIMGGQNFWVDDVPALLKLFAVERKAFDGFDDEISEVSIDFFLKSVP